MSNAPRDDVQPMREPVSTAARPLAVLQSVVPLHDVIGLLQNGETVDGIVTRCSPNLTGAQVYECLAYYEDHRGEIDVLVARQMAPGNP